ncbi:myb family transcription factor EFM [Prunus yedoensis var. nudiflora]|uniref:Myb family transcription factor EFM n=1 Tax=Prunus yedoensis var. nudiflora TaxID=2094558 RepID=A0A314Y6U1_PRUYE|nr:myb family transcription factor EFM [Prunus yedoensis var. nudiflora]
MGSVPPELSLDFRPTFVPKTISDFLREVSMIGNVSERLSKLDDFVKRLEEEMRKIDAFKRELPLCMFLLNDAILALKEDAMQCAAPNVQPVLEEFIPLKKDCEKNNGGTNNNKKEKDCRDKKNWMSSVQLWNTDNYQHPSSDFPYDRKQVSEIDSKRNEAENGLANEDPFQTCRNRTGGRAFMPFKTYPAFSVTAARKEDKEELPIHGLSLLTPGIKNPKEESASSGSRSTCGRAVSFSTANAQSNMRTPPQQPTSRKQRRCWSPELHRRFVNALQQLGGSQVATPKQIRELMQVDGLTNDEVKSHLQKYRLHTRRVPAATAAPDNQSVVVLGGLWMSQDHNADSSKASSSQSGSPQGPLHLTGTGGDDEDDEDAKSESYSWKGHIQKPGKDDV